MPSHSVTFEKTLTLSIDGINKNAEIEVTDAFSIKDKIFDDNNVANPSKGAVEGVFYAEENQKEKMMGPRDISLQKNESNLDEERANNLVDVHDLPPQTAVGSIDVVMSGAEIDDANENMEKDFGFADQVDEEQPEAAESKNDVTGGSVKCSDREASKEQEIGNGASASKTSLVDIDENILETNDADHQTDNAETTGVEQLQQTGWVIAVSDGSMMDVDQDKDQGASKFQMSSVEANEDLVTVEGTLIHEAGHVTTDPSPINPVEGQSKIISMETKVDYGSIVGFDEGKDHECCLSTMPLVSTRRDTRVEDAMDGEAEAYEVSAVAFGDGKDQQSSVFRISVLNSDQAVHEDGGIGLDSICFDATLSYQIDSENWDACHEEIESIQALNANPVSIGMVDERNVIVYENTNGKHKSGGGNEELLNETEKEVIQSVANDHCVNYHLPPFDKTNFSNYDLVWGKVKNHPWWPGQIFDPSDASKLAMKYQKNDSFLVAFYGGKTFAWCDESQLKPFHSYFSQFEKQCSLDTFMKAIHDILVEVSRRVELEMACYCLPEDEHTNIKYQKVENVGIRGGNINSIIDRATISYYFQPDKLLEYIQALAQFPNGRVDRLEFVIAQCQLKAFYQSKGYPELPVFTLGGGLIESTADNSLSIDKEFLEDILENCTPAPSDLQASPFNEREHGFEYEGRQKSTSELAENRIDVCLANGSEIAYVTSVSENSIISSLSKNHIIIESDRGDSRRCEDSFADMDLKPSSPAINGNFKTGEFVLRAASQLTLKKCVPQAEHQRKDAADSDVLIYSPVKNPRPNSNFMQYYNFMDNMFSQLCLVASDPTEEYSFLSTLVDFFTSFRNSCFYMASEVKQHFKKRKRIRPRKVISLHSAYGISCSDDEKHVVKPKRGRPRKVISQRATSDVSCSDDEKLVGKRKRGTLASNDASLDAEKPSEKRKRGRPRKNPWVASPNSSDKKLVKKQPTCRPKKVNCQLASHEYSASEDTKPVKKCERDTPNKVNLVVGSSEFSTPDQMKDSYWSAINDKSHMQNQKKRISTGKQLQHVAMNTNMRHVFDPERSIINIEEKIVDECMPTVLILSFDNAKSLPSKTHLVRIFSRYGPLKEAETDIMWTTNCARVVFRRRIDADIAFSSAGKYNMFGHGLLSYQLKPWTPNANHEASPRTTSQDNDDVTCVAREQDNDDLAPITTTQVNHDAEVPITLQDKCDEGHMGCDLEHSEPISMLQDNHDVALAPQDNHDVEPIATPNYGHDLEQIITVQANHDAEAFIRLQDKCNAGPNVGINLTYSVQEDGGIALDTRQTASESMQSSLQEKHDPSLVSTTHENQDAVPTSPLCGGHESASITTQENPGATPINMPRDNYDATLTATSQEESDAMLTEDGNFKVSDEEESVMNSEFIQVEDESSDLADQEDIGKASDILCKLQSK